MVELGWWYLPFALMLVAPALIMVASIYYFRRGHSRLSVALLAGAVGQFVMAFASQLAGVFFFGPPPWANWVVVVRQVVVYAGLAFGLLFAVSLIFVLKGPGRRSDGIAAANSSGTETEGSAG